MKTKIAIAGLPKSNKTLLAMALSNMTGIPYIRSKTMYEWKRMFDLNNDLTWKDACLIAAFSFFERVKTESYYDTFISDGASFSELMCLKINYEPNDIIKSLEHASALYAAKQYDFIIHAVAANDGDLANDFYLKYNIAYKIYNTEFLEQTLSEISTDLNLPTKISVESSIFQTQRDLFHSGDINLYNKKTE